MKSTASRNNYLKLVYNATPIANLADNAVASPAATISVALHSADPGVGGSQTTNEIAYTGYVRPTPARTSGGFTVTGNSVSPAAVIGFGACSAGSATATHFSTGMGAGASVILHSGIIGSRLGPFTATAADTLTIPGLSGVAIDDRFIAQSVDGSSLPAGVTEGTAYWVKTVSGNDITLSATQGGATLDITGAGDGLAYRSTPIVISAGVTPQLGTATAITEE